MKYMKPYLIFNVAVWLPWGLICIFDLATIQNIIGVTSVNASGSTDVRVMYGGVQTAMGLMAARALYDQRHFETFLHALAIMGCTMALSRTIGLILDGSSTFYTWAVLLYEAS
ncbi:MAG: DUF4345 family protein, partial [Myxococcales bacterium]